MRILYIEDEMFIANTCRKFLQNQGHSVTIAEDGQEGIDVYTSNFEMHDPFDLVITDYRMPKKDGAQVIKEILEINPAQKIILATAYGAEYAQLGIPTYRVPVLPKPFSFDELGRLVLRQAAIVYK